MKKILIPLLCWLVPHWVQAQHCSENLNTTSPTVNIWDWRQEEYYSNIYITGEINAHTPPVLSPFYTGGGCFNPNLNGFCDAYDLGGINNVDCQPEDGWELLFKYFGSGMDHVDNPSFALYNKYTGVIRVFLCIINGPTGTTPHGAIVKLSFANSSNRESALLTHLYSIAKPVIEFPTNVVMTSPNYYAQESDWWIYADFPTAYDPCACNYVSRLQFEFDVIGQANVTLDADISGMTTQIIESGAGTSNNVVDNSFQSFLQTASGQNLYSGQVYNSWQTFDGALDILINNNPNGIKQEMETELSNLGNSILSGLGNFQFLPYINTLSGLFNYFASNRKNSSAGQKTPIVSKSRFLFNGTGTITSSAPLAYRQPYNPGTFTGVSPDKPIYNNILGVWNILEPIKVLYSDYDFPGGGASWTDIRQYKIKDDIKYVVNPASGLEVSDIKASLLVSYKTMESFMFTSHISQLSFDHNYFPKPVPFHDYDQCYGVVTFEERLNRMGYELDHMMYSDDINHDYIDVSIRTPFTPLSCFKNQSIFLMRYDPWDTDSKFDLLIKFIIKLKKINDTGEDVVLVLTYPVELENSGCNCSYYLNFSSCSNTKYYVDHFSCSNCSPPNGYAGSALPALYWGIQEDLNIAGNYTSSQNFYAWNSVNINDGAQFSTAANFSINAGNEILWNNDVFSYPDNGFNHIYQIQSYPPGCIINLANHHYSTSEIASFCAPGGPYDTHSAARFANLNSVSTYSASESKLSASPNPSSSGRFDIELSDKNQSIRELKILDITGRNIEFRKADINQNKANIDLSKTISGIYFLEVTTTTNKKFTTKIAVNK